jgi:hypothetical protein
MLGTKHLRLRHRRFLISAKKDFRLSPARRNPLSIEEVNPSALRSGKGLAAGIHIYFFLALLRVHKNRIGSEMNRGAACSSHRVASCDIDKLVVGVVGTGACPIAVLLVGMGMARAKSTKATALGSNSFQRKTVVTTDVERQFSRCK